MAPFSMLLSILAAPFVSSLVLPGLSPPSQSQPNPIYTQYGLTDVTATINSTLVVVPLAFSQARALIPSQYGILTNAYKKLLPGWPDDMYPLVVSSQLDHDIRGFGASIPDFITFRLTFPFVDILNDGFSSFAYTPINWMTPNVASIISLTAYGVRSPPVIVEPPSDPYEYVPNPWAFAPGEVSFSFRDITNTIEGSSNGKVNVAPVAQAGVPWDFVRNVTNQPITGNGVLCDKQIRIFNTSLTRSPFEPVPVQGKVSLSSKDYPLKLEGFQKKDSVEGWLFAAAFKEENFIKCSDLKGYRGTGSGDSL